MAKNNEVSIVSYGGDYDDKTVKRLLPKNSNKAIAYQTLEARLTFNKLKKAFTKAPILQHFDLEYHIRIKDDV